MKSHRGHGFFKLFAQFHFQGLVIPNADRLVDSTCHHWKPKYISRKEYRGNRNWYYREAFSGKHPFLLWLHCEMDSRELQSRAILLSFRLRSELTFRFGWIRIRNRNPWANERPTEGCRLVQSAGFRCCSRPRPWPFVQSSSYCPCSSLGRFLWEVESLSWLKSKYL